MFVSCIFIGHRHHISRGCYLLAFHLLRALSLTTGFFHLMSLFQEIPRNSSASSHTQPWSCLLSTGRSTDCPVFGCPYYIHRGCKRRLFQRHQLLTQNSHRKD